MTTAIIITICTLLLIAYIFDLTSARTRIPSVILLLLLGWIVKQISLWGHIYVPDISAALPVLGTVGLILIVLEGGLELELDRSHAALIRKSLLVALLPMLLLSLLLAYVLHCMGQGSFRLCLINAIPLSVISSAVAIPSVKNLLNGHREFVVYESSLSDIFGVLLFNFITVNTTFGLPSFGNFGLEILVVIVLSFAATIGLAMLLQKIDHPIKSGPIIILVILIYAISKVYHLPGLIFILFFGLFLGNIDQLKGARWIEKLHLHRFDKEVEKFKGLTIEAAFLVRALFFLLFGYHIDTAEVIDAHTSMWALGIVAAILIIRAIHLKLVKLPLTPLLFIAPRGLITILLFLSIDEGQNIPLVNRSLIMQIIVLSALLMMSGLMAVKKPAAKVPPPPPPPVPDADAGIGSA